MRTETASRSAFRRVPSVLLPALALALCGAGVAAVFARRVGLEALLGSRLIALEGALLVALVLCALALLAQIRDLSRPAGPRSQAQALGPAVVLAVAGWQGSLYALQPFQRIWFDAAAALVAGAWAGLVLWKRRSSPEPTRLRRGLGAAALALALSLVSAEVGLRAVAALAPSALLSRAGEAPRKLIERFPCRPGQARFGFPCNSAGHYDEEFYRARPGERALCSIGDSFNLGSVPHAHHFTTVCEGELGIAVHNLGVAGIGPREYLALLLDEALPLAPEAVVVNLFVGNDLDAADVERGLPDPLLREWLERERVLLWVLPRRLARIARERARMGEGHRPVAIVQGEQAVAERFPWLNDPSLEKGTLSEEAFLRLETERARAVCLADPVSLSTAFESLLAMRDACGTTPFGVLLIPDEFQVEDGLWERIQAADGARFERDRPQRLLGTWLQENGIPFLDLLGDLRAVPPDEEGRRHLYHLRDTHFNARGNLVAGQALARFCDSLIEN